MMTRFISLNFAMNFLLYALSAVLIFHMLILAQIIPFEIVWGGRLKDVEEMRKFEIISIIANLCMLLIIGIRARKIPFQLSPKMLQIIIGAMGILFLLNTLGNLFSQNNFERYFFSPITLILSLCCFRIAFEKTPDK
ncbi:MAG: hypothetical protein KA797_07205 [Chitinophagales bacterium]|nr:hypothetical protein [Chitinophagales bacterium]